MVHGEIWKNIVYGKILDMVKYGKIQTTYTKYKNIPVI